MKKTFQQRRLDAIKLKFVFFTKECACCKSNVKLEKMWTVKRYIVNAKWKEFFYCQECMHSAEEVLHEVDTDSHPFGIVGVDKFQVLPRGTNPPPTTPIPEPPGKRTQNINNT